MGLVISGFGFWFVVLEVWVCRLLGLVQLWCFGLCYLFLGCFGWLWFPGLGWWGLYNIAFLQFRLGLVYSVSGLFDLSFW